MGGEEKIPPKDICTGRRGVKIYGDAALFTEREKIKIERLFLSFSSEKTSNDEDGENSVGR